MKKLFRIICWLDTFQSWLFDGEPHIDGHEWRDVSVKKVKDRYYIKSTCQRCGLVDNRSWVSEINYLRMKDLLPPPGNETKGKRTTKR